MLKIPFQHNKETVIGLSLFGGAFVLFLINLIVAGITLIQVYGVKETVDSKTAIDGTVLSEAVRIISSQ